MSPRCAPETDAVTARWRRGTRDVVEAGSLATAPAQSAIRSKRDRGMTERTTKKDNIEDLLPAGKTPAEIAMILGVDRRHAVAVTWRMRNPERERAIKRAVAERLRADPA